MSSDMTTTSEDDPRLGASHVTRAATMAQQFFNCSQTTGQQLFNCSQTMVQQLFCYSQTMAQQLSFNQLLT